MARANLLKIIFCTGIILTSTSCQTLAQEIKTRYATVHFADEKLLDRFANELYLGRSLSLILRKMKTLNRVDEVANKVDLVVEKVETVLDMYPPIIQFSLVLLPSKKEVQQLYQQKYGKQASHIAYYSLKEKTIYVSVNDANLRVMAHEMGHMIVDHYFKVRPPYHIHEVMAQYAEEHVTD
ncbi:MAG: hypothetical protein ABFR97_05350 [Thermodesulfobacteriota bacterium]